MKVTDTWYDSAFDEWHVKFEDSTAVIVDRRMLKEYLADHPFLRADQIGQQSLARTIAASVKRRSMIDPASPVKAY
jgi:hypothetical protein